MNSSPDPTVLVRLVTRAVEAVGEAEAFAAASADLARFDAEQARVVLGWVLRQTLEERSPDGLDADDVREAVATTARAGLWFERLDPRILVVVLTAALGEHPDPEEIPRLGHELVLAHSVLLVHQLVTPRGLRRAVERALAEVRRAETMELP